MDYFEQLLSTKKLPRSPAPIAKVESRHVPLQKPSSNELQKFQKLKELAQLKSKLTEKFQSKR